MSGVLCRTMVEVQEFLDADEFSWEGKPILWSTEIDGEDRVHSFHIAYFDSDVGYKARKWLLSPDKKPDVTIRRNKDKPFDVESIYALLSLTGNRFTGHPECEHRDIPF